MPPALRAALVSSLLCACAPAPREPSPIQVPASPKPISRPSASAPTPEIPPTPAPPPRTFATVPGFPKAVKVPIPPSIAVTVGTWHHDACALTKDGEVWCWEEPESESPSRPEPKPIPGINPPKLLSDGSGHACAADEHGVVCWGSTMFQGEDNDSAYEPEALHHIVGLAPKALAVGDNHACAVDASSHLVCWGDDSFGAVGKVPKAGIFIDVSASSFGSCAVRAKGLLTCWGSASIEPWELGGKGWSPPPRSVTEPHDLLGVSDVVRVSIRSYPWCILRKTGEVLCWDGGGGSGEEAAMLHKNPLPKNAIVRELKDASAIEGSIVTRKSGAIVGITSADHRDFYLAVPIGEGVLRDVVSADGSLQQGCAVTSAGDVYCWSP